MKGKKSVFFKKMKGKKSVFFKKMKGKKSVIPEDITQRHRGTAVCDWFVSRASSFLFLDNNK